jgi:hypothetical protein
MLQEQLDRVALMLEHTAPYTHREAFVWRCLSQHVDAQHFERSGKIIAPRLSPEDLLGSGVPGSDAYSLDDVRQGLDTLIAHNFLTVAQVAKEDRFRMYLPQSILSGNDVSTG